jgi:shikimate dehydrogenase
MPASPLKLGLIGHPLSHSLSPLLHTELLRLAGLEGFYEAYPTPPEAVAEAFTRFRREAYTGINVTIPHKLAALTLVSQIDPRARLVGAVNTVVFRPGGQTTGYNTDVSGFLRSLPESARTSLQERPTLILGAGGSARAVVAGLVESGIPELTLAVRQPDRAKDLMTLAKTVAAGIPTMLPVRTLRWEPESAPLLDLSKFRLVVNTSPVGMHPNATQTPLSPAALATLPADACVMDLVYRPDPTLLVANAQAAGLSARSGLDMLLYQGVEAFSLWTGVTFSEEALAPVRQLLLDAARNVPDAP